MKKLYGSAEASWNPPSVNIVYAIHIYKLYTDMVNQWFGWYCVYQRFGNKLLEGFKEKVIIS